MNTCRKSGSELVAALAAEVPAPSDKVEVLVCPPYPYLGTIVEQAAGSGVQVGAQNCWDAASGAFTGEVACEMLKDIGCEWVILGHSERRTINKECDELINSKVKKALDSGLKVILCVGELLADREGNLTESVLERQMTGGLAGIESTQMADVVIAYEPVWAIGTGKVATDEQAEAAHLFLRNWVTGRFDAAVSGATRILYGGSVKAENAVALLGQPNVDGALVGGASLKADAFIPIIKAGAGLNG